MRILYTLFFSLFLTTVEWDTPTLALAGPDPAIASAEGWLALVDGGEFMKSWTTASTHFQRMVSHAQWQQALNAYRTPIGTLISRTRPTIQRTTTLPGLPDGTYVGITFQSSFTKKASTTETVVVTQDPDGHWKVIGYTIK